MAHISLVRRAIAEFFATAFLLSVVIGANLQAEAMTKDVGVVMLIVWFSLMCALILLIFVFSPISGAHLNPVVTWVMVFKRHIKTMDAVVYTVAQILGGIAGSIVANLMFNTPAIQYASHVRNSPGELIGEFISTAGLIAIILLLSDRGLSKWAWAVVPAWIGTTFLFTSSTCFANPAVTIGRIFSYTGAGIEANSVLPFIFVQFVAGAIGIWIAKLLRLNPAAN